MKIEAESELQKLETERIKLKDISISLNSTLNEVVQFGSISNASMLGKSIVDNLDKSTEKDLTLNSFNVEIDDYLLKLQSEAAHIYELSKEYLNRCQTLDTSNDSIYQEPTRQKREVMSVSEHDNTNNEEEEYFTSHSPSKSVLSNLKDKIKKKISISHGKIDIENCVSFLDEFADEINLIVERQVKEKEDLQLQIESTERQLKSVRTFLEEQTNEREMERDEYQKEIESLTKVVKEKEKEQISIQEIMGENKTLRSELEQITVKSNELEEQTSQLENQLKQSVDKIFMLREIIADLESQVPKEKSLEKEEKSENLAVTPEHQENDASEHSTDEVSSLKEKLVAMDNIMKTLNAERSMIVSQIKSQLKSVQSTIDRKITLLESKNAVLSNPSTTCNSPSEDVSVQQMNAENAEENMDYSYIDELHKTFERLAKHSRIEEVMIKRMVDLECQIDHYKSTVRELQQEKEILDDRISDHLLKISSLQSRLDEQRIRTEQLHKQSTSELVIKVRDLQDEISILMENIEAKDKKIATMGNQMETLKMSNDKQDFQLNVIMENEKLLKVELDKKLIELENLQLKVKNDMISKSALPDLMETILSEKNIEINLLEEKIKFLTKELEAANLQKVGTFEEKMVSISNSSEEPDLVRFIDTQKNPINSIQIDFNLHEPSHKEIPKNNLVLEMTPKEMEAKIEEEIVDLSEDNKSIRSVSELREEHHESIVSIRSLNDSKLDSKRDNTKLLVEIDKLKHQIKELTSTIDQKNRVIDDIQSEYKSLKMENNNVENLKRELSLKSFALEKCKFDLNDYEEQIVALKDKMYKIKNFNSNGNNKETTSNNTVEEIAGKLERELQYSAKLDFNLIRVFESENLSPNISDDNFWKRKYDALLTEVESEKKHVESLKLYEKSLLSATKSKLNSVLDNEKLIKKLFEIEEKKTESLTSHIDKINGRINDFNNDESRCDQFNELHKELRSLKVINEKERQQFSEILRMFEKKNERFLYTYLNLIEYCQQLKTENDKLRVAKNEVCYPLTQNFEHSRNLIVIQEQEERLHLLMKKNLRSESLIKALIFQKRYLSMIVKKVDNQLEKKRSFR